MRLRPHFFNYFLQHIFGCNLDVYLDVYLNMGNLPKNVPRTSSRFRNKVMHW